MDPKPSVNSFPLWTRRSYLDFLLSFNYPLRVLFLLKVIAKANRKSSTLNTIEAREMLTMETSYISHVLLLKSKCVSHDRSM